MILRRRWNPARSHQWLSQFGSTGESPVVLGRPSIGIHSGELRIGDRLRLASRPVGSHFSVGPGAVLEIGNDVWIGHGAAIASHERVEIGAGTRIGPFVIIMDSNFHSGAGDQSEQHDCRPVVIGKGCRIGSRVTITRGARIGDGVHILAGSVVSGEFPAGVCLGGARARVLGRAGEITVEGQVAALSLPALLRECLQLESLPDLGEEPIPADRWAAEHRGSLANILRERLQLEIAVEALEDARCYADVARRVQQALRS